MPKISPFLWFDGQAEAAAQLYVSVFAHSRILHLERYGPDAARAAGRPEGSVMTVSFELAGQRFVALNGGPAFRINPAVSFVAACADQAEIDRVWDRLAEGGQAMQCGWVTDRFGVTWQVVPEAMAELLDAAGPDAASRVWQAMLAMKKLDIEALRRARDGQAA